MHILMQAEAARGVFEAGLAASAVPLTIESAARAWQSCLASVERAYG